MQGFLAYKHKYLSLLCLISYCAADETSCHKDKATVSCSHEKKQDSFCDEVIELPLIEDSWIDKPKIFFIESSDRPHLDARQTCSIESAARIGGVPAVVVLTAKFLDLSVKNETCQLFRKYSEKSIFFRRVDKAEIFKGTPLQEVYESGRLDKSPTPIVHYSDAIRLVLVHHYGGWYSDLDMIFLRPVSHLSNVISSDEIQLPDRKNPKLIGKGVSNAIFNLPRGHPLLAGALELFSKSFNGKWASGGPTLLTKILKSICGLEKKVWITTKVFTPDRCHGINVLEPSSFFPLGWFDARMLLEPTADEVWSEIFKDSFTAHFFQSSSIHSSKILKPKNYGKEVPGLLYLAVRYCPMSFDSVKLF